MNKNRNMQWLKKKITIGLLLLVVATLTGCYSIEERALASEYKKQAKINAVDYVKDKYGFTATAKSALVQKGGTQFSVLDPFPTSVVFVTMEYADKEFVVKIL